ncbi:MAG: hypothetical protein D6742_08085 [Cyanobacteria bacterium J069]|nr:MAG: hypothetical protein D6742_08085 [Cyanobacteria bacterium J069]
MRLTSSRCKTVLQKPKTTKEQQNKNQQNKRLKTKFLHHESAFFQILTVQCVKISSTAAGILKTVTFMKRTVTSFPAQSADISKNIKPNITGIF